MSAKDIHNKKDMTKQDQKNRIKELIKELAADNEWNDTYKFLKELVPFGRISFLEKYISRGETDNYMHQRTGISVGAVSKAARDYWAEKIKIINNQ
jgi:uncharacterized protein YerC